MSERKAAIKAKATAFERGNRVRESQIVDEVVELTNWRRDLAGAARCVKR